MGEETKKVAVWGSPVVVGPIIDELDGVELVEVLNDDIPVGAYIGKNRHWRVTGSRRKAEQLLCEDNLYFVLTTMTMQNKIGVWKKMMDLEIPRSRFISLIHPTAVVPFGYCYMGNGVVMAPLSQLGPDVHIEDNCILYANSYIGHGTTLERYVVVANNASIGARVVVERGAHIGSNSSIREGVRIGEFSLIGIGSVVLEDIPPRTIVAGVPARKLRELDV